jgi:hypothetical protein
MAMHTTYSRLLPLLAMSLITACGDGHGAPTLDIAPSVDPGRVTPSPSKRSPDGGASATQPQPQPQASVPDAAQIDSAPDAALIDSAMPIDAPARAHAVKWNPGHWMLTYTQLENGRTLSVVQDELTSLSESPGIVGYKTFVTWGYLEPQEGHYYFDDIDAMIGPGGQFTTMTPARHLILQLNPNVFNSGTQSVPRDERFLPSYIYEDPATYGPAVLGDSGLANPNGYGGFWVQATGGYSANFVNPNVQARLIALLQALGARYDDNPLFEGVILCADDALYPVKGSGISTAAYIGALQTILSAAAVAMPTSNVGMQNAWAGEPTSSQELEEWMLAHRILPASSDTAGQPAWSTGYAPASLSWGVQAWLGVQSSGSTWAPPTPPLQSLGHAMMDVQGGDFTTPSVYPTAYTPLEIIQACNTQYGCSHVFWSRLLASDDYTGFDVPTATQWPNLLATVQANPLTNVSYPSAYP